MNHQGHEEHKEMQFQIVGCRLQIGKSFSSPWCQSAIQNLKSQISLAFFGVCSHLSSRY
jgi:hypothetical protein